MNITTRRTAVGAALAVLIAGAAVLAPGALAADDEGGVSPDYGGRILYSAAGNGPIKSTRIFSVKPDGTGKVQLTDESYARDGNDLQAAMSPDGTRIAYVHGDEIYPPQIWTMNSDGTDRRPIADDKGSHQTYPAWSADGTKIAFSSTRGGGGIWTMNADGSDPRQLTTGGGEMPTYSPDGTTIAYVARASDGEDGIFVMGPDGSGARQLFDSPGSEYAPVFSPDGSRLAFQSNRSGRYDVWTMKLDGTDLVNVTRGRSSTTTPSWSPDGSLIAFEYGNRIGFVDSDGGSDVVWAVADQTAWLGDWQTPGIRVSGADNSRPYGEANPTLTPAYAGFLLGDSVASLTSAATCSTTATEASPAGTYPITCGGASSGSYQFGYVAGTLTVTKAATSLQAVPLVAALLRPSARLTRGQTPVPGQQITFTAGGRQVCAATTAADGWARCPAMIAPRPGGYAAAFAGDGNLEPATATAGLTGR